MYACVDSNNIKTYYSYYPDRILKTSEISKVISYTVFYGSLPANHESKTYLRFSSLDTQVLVKGDRLLDSLGYGNFKKSKGAEGYFVEVNFNHGWPKHRKFRPL